MIGNPDFVGCGSFVFQPMRARYAGALDDGLDVPCGTFSSSFAAALSVVRGLRKRGFRAYVKVTNPNYSI